MTVKEKGLLRLYTHLCRGICETIPSPIRIRSAGCFAPHRKHGDRYCKVCEKWFFANVLLCPCCRHRTSGKRAL